MPAPSSVRILDQRTADERGRPFLPGMGRTWLLPLYDLFSRTSGVLALHRRAVELAGVAPGQSVLDVGCGTGNLSLAVLSASPEARVTGLDPDGSALRRAAGKARRRRVSLTLLQGYADRLPAEDGSLDHVVSGFALHHLDDAGRSGFAREALRVLRPGGRLTIVDFGDRPDGDSPAGHGHGHAHAGRHLRGAVPRLVGPLVGRRGSRKLLGAAAGHGGALVALLGDAGFGAARELEHADHQLGPISFVQATRG